jgi:hypothetical protein
MKISATLILFASLVCLCQTPTRTYVSFDPPDSIGTTPVGIADNGYVVGEYKSEGSKYALIFLRSPKNRYLKFPHPTTMIPTAIDAAGDVLGVYGKGNSFVGFLRSFATGSITYSSGEFEPTALNSSGTCTGMSYSDRGNFGGAYTENPCLSNGGIRIGVPDTYWINPVAINTMGNVAGSFLERTGNVVRGFVWNAEKQHAKPITVSNSVLTRITDMNDAGTAAGFWQDSASLSHSFFVTSSGVITTFDPPGFLLSYALGINQAGATAGYSCNDTCNGAVGYVRNPDGTFSMISFPGSTATRVSSINKGGTVTGSYVDTAGVSHGFTY